MTESAYTLDAIQTIHAQWHRSEERLARVRLLIEQGDRALAKSELRALVSIDPDYPVAQYEYARLLADDGDATAAVEHALLAMELGLTQPSVFAFANELAATMSDARDLSERIAAFNPPDTPTVTLAMIAKNEEEYLAQCLKSVEGIVTQIVVVDTGSSDATVEIATRLGAQVEHFAWQDDFALARNESLKHATGEWVLWLDADEELTSESREWLLRLLRDESVGGAHLRIDNLMGHKTVPFLTTRLWRNHATVRFKQPIHEQVFWAIAPYARRTGRQIVEARDVVIKHYGYQPSVASKRGKDKRNLDLLRKLVQREPDNAYALFHYAGSLREQGERDEALRQFRKWEPMAMRQHEAQNHWLRVGFANYAGALNDGGQFSDAISLVDRALEKSGETASLRFQKAYALHRVGQHEDALAELHRAENVPRDVNASVESIEFQPLLVPMLTAEIYLALDRQDDAKALFEEALRLAPNDPRPRCSLARLHISAGDLDRASDELEKALSEHPEEPQTLATLAQVELFRLNLDRAIDLLTKAAPLDPQGEVARMLGEAHLLNGDREGAFEAWRAASVSKTGAKTLLELSDGNANALRDLDETKTRDEFWSLVARTLTLSAKRPLPGIRFVEALTDRVGSDTRYQALRADLMRVFLQRRYREGIQRLRGGM
ncbi:MAG: tetratricopeptide repeat protein [Candidatus Poribacteria bacterium]|nr:tetratricopeptide repeat protein [Candidatus Poribacteria bacterium]